MGLLAHERYCDEIVRLTGELRASLRGADLGATVPTCPDWTLRELAEHVGRAHRWAGEIVRTRAAEPVAEEKVPDNSPGSDDPAALDAWLAEGAAGTADALREAGPDAEAWSWAWAAARASGPAAWPSRPSSTSPTRPSPRRSRTR